MAGVGKATYLAVDLGASSGRVMAGWLEADGKITLQEIHRFENVPVTIDCTLCWNFDALLEEIASGLTTAIGQAEDAGRPVRTVGVDSWAVDFGLVNESGALVGPVVHYRDTRTRGMMDKVFAEISQRELFSRTGIQFLPFNTIYQLAALKQYAPDQLERASHFMMIADLVAWRLTGEVSCEYTNATTTQLFDARQKQWATDLMDRLGLSAKMFGQVVQPGHVIGKLQPAVMHDSEVVNKGQRNSADPGIAVVAVATHDTASAVAAVPARAGENIAYLSCGTWSLLGTELTEPILTEDALAANFTNEGGASGTIRFLKNIMGLWILQECRRHWKEFHYSWQQLEQMAREADAAARERGDAVPLFDVDDARFLPPGDMPLRVCECCAESGARLAADDHGGITAAVLRSLAARYKQVFEKVEDLTVQRFERLYVVGGGVQNKLLLEWTEEALGREVVAGPAEATALGNIGIQMIAAGELRDLADLRSRI